MRKGICLFILCIMVCIRCNHTDFETKIEQAVASQLNLYPESTLQDLYKNFFQDRFGAGHAISDTASVRRYLEQELHAFETTSSPMIEVLGWEHNFVRINLALVKEGTIPFEILLDAFIESADGVNPEAMGVWPEEWEQIVRIIEKMDIKINRFDDDKRYIDSILQKQPHVALHHSKAFRQHYHPHYRIVEKAIFEQQLKRFLI